MALPRWNQQQQKKLSNSVPIYWHAFKSELIKLQLIRRYVKHIHYTPLPYRFAFGKHYEIIANFRTHHMICVSPLKSTSLPVI